MFWLSASLHQELCIKVPHVLLCATVNFIFWPWQAHAFSEIECMWEMLCAFPSL